MATPLCCGPAQADLGSCWFFLLKLLEKKGVDGMNEDRVPKTQPLGEKACLQCTGKAQELCLDLHIFSPHYVNPTEQ